MKVSQFFNKNQFLIDTGNKIYLQSYQSLVAKYDAKTNKFTLYKDWDYSNTTRKHVYLFISQFSYNGLYLGGKTKRQDILKAIEKGIIKLCLKNTKN